MHAPHNVTDIRNRQQRSNLPPTREGAWPAALHLSIAVAPARVCDGMELAARLLDYDVEGMLAVSDGDVVLSGLFMLEITPEEILTLIADLSAKRAKR